MRVPWTAKRRNYDILEEVGGRQLWNSVVARKLRYFGHIMRKEDENLEKCIITRQDKKQDKILFCQKNNKYQRPRRTWSVDIKEWTHLSVSTEEALQSAAADQGSRSLEKRCPCPSCRRARRRSRQLIRHQRRRGPPTVNYRGWNV